MAGRLRAHTARAAVVDAVNSSDPRQLAHAIAALRALVDGLPPRQAARCQFTLGIGWHALFERTGDLSALDEACVAAAAAGTKNIRYVLSLAGVLSARAVAREQPAELDRVIDILRAVVVRRLDPVALATGLTMLASAYHARFEAFADDADLDASVEIGTAAVRAVPRHGELRARCLTNLVNPLRTRGERRGDVTDLDLAVEAARCAVRFDSSSAARSNLGTALVTRFGVTGTRADLDAAIEACRGAVAVDDQPAFHASCVANLVTALLTRVELTGDLDDLEQARSLARSVPATTGVRSAIALAMAESSNRQGNPHLADDAIEILRTELAESTAQAVQRPADLVNLSRLLSERYLRSGARVDLDEAIAVASEAVDALPENHSRRRLVLSGLAVDLCTRWELTRDPTDLATALAHAQHSTEGLGQDVPDRPLLLANQAGVLRHSDQDPEGHDRLIELLRTGSTGPGPSAAIPLTLLAERLLDRHERAGYPADLDAAIESADRAIALTEPDHPMLGQALFFRALAEPDPVSARAYAERAASVETAPPSMRAMAARRASGHAAAAGDWAGAAAMLRHVVELLDQTVPAELGRVDATRRLTKFAGLAVDAVAACVNAGDLDGAVEVWDRARAVLLGRALVRRRDLAELRRIDPELADRLTRLSRELDAVDHSVDPRAPGGPDADRQVVERRRAAVRERDEILDHIHARHGTLSRPASAHELLPAAGEGPTVLVNVSTIRCDALVLAHDGVTLVPLPSLHGEEASARASELLRRTTSDEDDNDTWLLDLLAWLWDTTAAPVLAVTGTGHPIRWCPSGPMAFLPLHAAGHHDTRTDPEPRIVLDLVDSSYSPAFLRRNPATTRMRPSAAIVTMAAGDVPLPAAADTAAVLRAHFDDDIEIVSDAGPDEVMAALTRHTWAHFACHTRGDVDDPWAGALMIGAPIPVATLATLRLPAAELAFLAACSTGQPGTTLPDEAVHLASVFQLLGYRHVIATLWPVADRIAHRVAREIYHELSGEDGLDADRAAGAVRRTVLRTRNLVPHKPWAWAGYVHCG